MTTPFRYYTVPELRRIIAAMAQGATCTEAARAAGRSRHTARIAARKVGLLGEWESALARGEAVRLERSQEARSWRHQGLSVDEIALAMDVDREQVRRLLAPIRRAA